MKYSTIFIFFLLQVLGSVDLLAQKACGKLSDGDIRKEIIELSVYHQYDLKLKEGTIGLLEISEFEAAKELTVVSPQGIVVERMNMFDTANFLIFEATEKGTYQFYVQLIDDELESIAYELTAHFIEGSKKGKLDQIKSLIQLLEKPDRAGAAVVIQENDELIFEHYYGYADVENRIMNDENTVFELASVSKQFTGMAIAKLIEQGLISSEDDIRRYFPELPNYKIPIRVKHLLNHSSGIIDSEYPLALAGFEKDPIELERVMNFLQKTPSQYFDTGTEFEYSNDAYTLLGELVHRVTKQTFKSYVEEHIFMPLGMQSSVIRDSPEQVIPNRAISYKSDHGEEGFRRLSFDFYPPGGCSVRSSISDLCKWVSYLNDGYHSKGNLFTRINQLELFPNGFPEKNLSFIFLGNDGEFHNYYLARKIYEIYLEDGLTPKDEKFEEIIALTYKPEKNKEELLSSLDLSEYEGIYFSEHIATSYQFELEGDTLFATSAAYSPIALSPIGKDSFQAEKEFMDLIVFKRDYNQEPSECNIFNEDDDHSIAFKRIKSSTKWSKKSYWDSELFQKSMMDTLRDIEATEKMTGFAVSVFNETDLLFQEGFGFADLKEKREYNAETVQLIASISKTITAMSVMKAAELQLLDIDDAINDYLPFEITNPNFPDEDITIRHLLTHTSSLDDSENYGRGYVFERPLEFDKWPVVYEGHIDIHNNNEKMSLSSFLEAICSPQGKWYQSEMYSERQPGAQFEYSNLGFALLGYIVEITSKSSFQDFTHQYILDPLEMNNSTWEFDQVDEKHHTRYYLQNYHVCPDYLINTIPDGGLYSNIQDLTKFLQEAMKGYAGRGTILSNASYQEMFRSQSDLIEIEGGLGWDLSYPCCIGHGGNDFGTATLMFFEPRTGIGRIVFSNTSFQNDEMANLFYGLMGLLFLEEW